MHRALLLVSSLVLLSTPFNAEQAIAGTEVILSKPLAWNSPEIFARWFKPSVPNPPFFSILDYEFQDVSVWQGNSNYKSELLLFIELALGDYLKTPDFSKGGKNAPMLFRHFGGDATLVLRDENVPDKIKKRLETEFKARNLKETFSHLGGYVIGRIDASPKWILDHYIIGAGKFLEGDEAEYEEFERREEGDFEEDVEKIIGPVVDFHLLTPLNESFDTLLKQTDPRNGAPENMLTRLSYKKWNSFIAWSIYKLTGYYPQNLLYNLNIFYDQLKDGTIVVLYGLSNEEPNPIGASQVYQNNGAYIFKPINVLKGGKSYTYTAGYFLWFFQGQDYSTLGNNIEKYLFTDDGWDKNPVATELRRIREHREIYYEDEAN